jgi:hypothetical protein
MTTFLLLVGAAVIAALVSFLLYRRAPRGWTRVFLAIAGTSALAFPFCAVLHNLIDAVFHVDEPVFFLLAVIAAPAGIAVGLIGAALMAGLQAAGRRG